MQGYIEKYFKDKNYGFIKSDDNTYFFHKTELLYENVKEGHFVEFEIAESDKGLTGKKIRQISDVNTYIVPDDVQVSKSYKIPNWEIIEKSDWQINASSDDSPDDAKDALKNLAYEQDINGLINLRYFKTTGKKKNYKFTIHNFEATCVNVGRKSPKGKFKREQIPTDINERFRNLKNEYNQEFRKKMRKCYTIWIFIILGIIAYNINNDFSMLVQKITMIERGFYLLVIILLIGIFFGMTTYKGKWLREID